MSDWTTPEDVPADTVERLHRWLLQEGNPEDAATPGERAVADIIRTFWPVPAATLSKELAHITEVWETWTTDMITGALTAATDRAKQVENDRDAARAEVKRERDLGDALAHERDDTRAELERVRDAVDPKGAGLPPGMTISEAVQTLVDGIPTGEHEGLTAEQWKHEYDRTRAEVERLTAERDEKEVLDTIDAHYTTTYAPHPNPADVKPGEAWIVECHAEICAAVKGSTDDLEWKTVSPDGFVSSEGNEDITLVTRLVPAPRVITNAEDLDRAKRCTIILDSVGVICERTVRGDGWFTTQHGTDQTPYIKLPATVLWEPEA